MTKRMAVQTDTRAIDSMHVTPVATFRHEEAVASSFLVVFNFFETQINVMKN